MAYNALNNLIDAYIYANGVQAITGQILNGVLKQMVSQLGSGYHLMGIAGPETVPASNDYAMAYFAATAGEYTDFGGITLAAGEVAVLLTSGNGSWSKETIYNVPTGTADLENTANFITNAVTDLVNYYTKTEVDDTLANYPTLEALATALADYYTKQEIDTTLEGYPTKQDQETALGDYYTKDEMDAALGDRYTKDETDTKLADYYKKTETYDKDEVDSIVAALSRQEYIVAWDGSSSPVVADIPAGVTVTYSGTTYTGTLAASASTVNKIYMVWNGTAYDMYGTSQDGGYSWVPMGTTTVDLSQYATKSEVSQLEAKVGDLTVTAEQSSLTSGGAYYTPGTVGQNISSYYSASGGKSTIYYNTADITGLKGVINISPLAGEGTSTQSLLWAVVDASGVILACENIQESGGSYSRQIDIATLVNPAKIYFAFHRNNTPSVSVKVYGLAEEIDAVNETLGKKADLVVIPTSKNLFDKTKAIDGFYINTTKGSLVELSGCAVSGLIPITPGTTYYLYRSSSSLSLKEVRFVGADGTTALKPIDPSTDTEYSDFYFGSTNGAIKAPNSAKYFQFTVKDTNLDCLDTAQLEVGDEYTGYEAYSEREQVPYSQLPTDIADISELTQDVQDLEDEVSGNSSSIERIQTKLSDIAEAVYSPNLYDKSQLREGYIQTTTGVFTATPGNDSYLTSPVIPILPNKYYLLVGRGSVKEISCLDGNGDPVKVKAPENGTEIANFVLPNADGTDSVKNGEFLTPATAESVQFTVKFNGSGTPDSVMLVYLGEYYVENPATPTYEDYGITGYKVKESAIPDNPLNGKSVIFAGDSICNASTDYTGGGGWAKRIGVKNNMSWQNLGISGGTLTDKNVVGSSFTISDTNFGAGADYIILEGGTNDADRIGSIIEGTTPANYGSYSLTGYTDAFTNQTFCGAVEYLLKKVISDYPSAKVGFIIAMKMGRTNDYTKEGNNRRAYFETIIQLCKKWGVPVLNLWDECTMNPRIASHYTSGENYLYVDGQHPTGRGYDILSPIIEAWMKTL